MKKKIIMIATTAVLTIGMATSAFAAGQGTRVLSGYGFCGGGYGIMCDQDGNFLDKEAFEANLDELLEDGLISTEDRSYFIERYEWCTTYGGGVAGTRGGGRGRGCGLGRSLGNLN